MNHRPFLPLAAVGLLLLAGCSTYITPGAKADLQALAPTRIKDAFEIKPTYPFPASIAVVRLQSPDYSNHYLRRNGGLYGQGRYSVVLSREIEEDKQLPRITALRDVSGLVALNRMLLSPKLESDEELRVAAARLQADLLLLYTFDTTFVDKDSAKPLSVISLGLSPTRKITAITTASAVLLDTRTGYVYSAYEVTERKATLSTSWSSADSADQVRRDTEKQAFVRLVDEFTASWPKLLARR